MISYIPNKFPRVLRIEPASNCNLKCSHCPTGTIRMDRGIMPDYIFQKVLMEVELHKNEIRVIVLYHGGEPLLNNNFFEYVRLLKSINPYFFIKTVSNASALTESNSSKLLDSSIDLIEFSLDGKFKSDNALIRINSNTDKIISNIKNLISLKNKLRSNLPEIVISTTQFLNDYDDSFYPENTPVVPSWLKDCFGDSVTYKANYAILWPAMTNVKSYTQFQSLGETKNYCDHINSTMTIRADGSVVACCYDLTSQLIMGSIADSSLLDIWNGDNYVNLRSSIFNRQYKSICNNCATVKPPIYLLRN